MATTSRTIAALLKKRRKELQVQWLKELKALPTASAKGRIAESDLDAQVSALLELLTAAAQNVERGMAVLREKIRQAQR